MPLAITMQVTKCKPVLLVELVPVDKISFL